MTTITAPVKTITLQALLPDLVRSCIVQQPSPPPDPGEEPPSPVTGPDIYTPVAPGVVYANLPAVTIVDTSPDQMIGCIIDTADNPQGRLNALFPSADEGDGVIERSTNDIWVFDGTTWDNVGPTPGPTIVTATVIPPWNEIASYDAIVRCRVEVTSLPYALSLLTEPAAYGVSIGVTVSRVVPRAVIALSGAAPTIATGASVLTPLNSVSITAHVPAISASINLLINIPAAETALAANTVSVSAGYSAAIPATALSLTVHAPTLSVSVSVFVPDGSVVLSAAVPAVYAGASVSVPAAAVTLEAAPPSIPADDVFAYWSDWTWFASDILPFS